MHASTSKVTATEGRGRGLRVSRRICMQSRHPWVLISPAAAAESAEAACLRIFYAHTHATITNCSTFSHLIFQSRCVTFIKRTRAPPDDPARLNSTQDTLLPLGRCYKRGAHESRAPESEFCCDGGGTMATKSFLVLQRVFL
jgi:hypothetical protein